MDNMIDEKAVTALMKFMGFERLSDYQDMSGCPAPSPSGPIMQFFNPKTKVGVQVCVGDYDDQFLFAEEHIIECQEKWNLKTGDKIYKGKIEVKKETDKKLQCPQCDWCTTPTVDPETGECYMCNRFFKIEVLPAN